MLDRIQEQLEAIYGLRCEYRASDFLVGPKEGARLGGTGRDREELLVSEGQGGLELALVLPHNLLERLARFESAPAHALVHDLAAFCEVAEGVSHFMYLSRAAGLDRKVSLLELEAQAEVDKFAACVLLRWGRGVGSFASDLMERLFETVTLRGDLSAQEVARYREAGRLGRTFCDRLMPMVQGVDLERLLSALRYAYRLGAEAKLRHLSQATL